MASRAPDKTLAYYVSHIATMPFIYAVLFPVILLDLTVIIYETICFPIYGIDRVRRSDFLMIDRQLMTYMSSFDKFNCYYCSYMNNALSYMREVAARTEVYWCPLKEAKMRKKSHDYYQSFAQTNNQIVIPNTQANHIIKQNHKNV